MDRNSAIGLTLIAALLFSYFYFFSPSPQEPVKQPVTEQSASVKSDTTSANNPVQSDSVLAASYGEFSSYAQGKESTTTVETQDLKITFSSRGGIISDAELKKYKTYSQKPLKLISPERSVFNLIAKVNGRDVDLYDLYYNVSQQKQGDSTIVTYSIQMADGATLGHRYSIPEVGYEIRYSIIQKGFDQQLNSDNLIFQWNDAVQLLEKDIKDMRNNTTITYLTKNEGFDFLGERAASDAETFVGDVKWVSIKQKFFLSSIISEGQNFSGGDISTMMSEIDTSVVEQAHIKLNIPKAALADGSADFKFYVGPNNYNIIGSVTEEFKKNVYLGWPPVNWINKFVIFPVFHFLTQFINNYGLIIIVLVVLLKLVLAPLSYKSYLSMAKMKVLKPELDEIKEKHGEDMAKVQQEQLKLYQQVGVNPISGCVPVLLQMPILFAMFYLFPASIELRQQPFLWSEDLSTYDSLIRLPFAIPLVGDHHLSLFTLLMTVSTLVYTWQNNQLSSVQGPMKTMSYLMPIIFFFVLNSFSAGLTFYYFVSNLVTFAQQAIIRRFVDEKKIRVILEENRKKNLAGGGGKKSRFMSKLEDAMKASEAAKKRAEEERKKKK